MTQAPRALLLAAGIGRRLGVDHPKCLLELGGHTLLERHLRLLHAMGVPGLTIGVGYQSERIQAVARAVNPGLELAFIHNPRYREGSVLTLWRLREVLRGGAPVLVLDADVLYDERMLERLLRSPHDNVFLLDRDFEDGDEPVKLCVRDGRLVEFRKRAEVACDHCGESVGFFRFSAETAAALAARTQRYIREGKRDAPHEEAIRDLLLERPEAFGWEDVTGLPWLEIDFLEDVERARREVLPRLRPLP